MEQVDRSRIECEAHLAAFGNLMGRPHHDLDVGVFDLNQELVFEAQGLAQENLADDGPGSGRDQTYRLGTDAHLDPVEGPKRV